MLSLKWVLGQKPGQRGWDGAFYEVQGHSVGREDRDGYEGRKNHEIYPKHSILHVPIHIVGESVLANRFAASNDFHVDKLQSVSDRFVSRPRSASVGRSRAISHEI